MEYIIPAAIEVASVLLITLIGVLGAWLGSVLAKRTQLQNIQAATDAVVQRAQETVGDLNQTFADTWRTQNEGGKLTDEQAGQLQEQLISITVQKLSQPALNVLQAAKVDVTELIRSAGEDWINAIKAGKAA